MFYMHSKRDIYGILIPVIPITTNFADSAFVRLSSSTPFHKCPDVQDSEGHVFVGELRKGNSCVYEAKPDTAATLFFISGDFKREWKYQLSVYSVYAPWILIQ